MYFYQAICLSDLNPKVEPSKLAVMMEDGDSGSPTFNFSSLYKNSTPNISDIKLTGIVIKAYGRSDGQLGITLRLSQSGFNEFIDDIISKDALGTNVNALTNLLTLQQALKDDLNQPDLTTLPMVYQNLKQIIVRQLFLNKLKIQFFKDILK